jgi:hypothetical protein
MSPPRTLVDKSHHWFRGWFRKVWEVRGGGLYACGFAVAFLVFEIGSLREDFAQIGAVFRGDIIGFVLDIFIDSLINTFKALIWPVFVLQFSPPAGLIALAAAYLLFPKYIKPPISRWLFPDRADEVNSAK